MKNADMPANPIDGPLYKREVEYHKIGIGAGIRDVDVYARGLTKREAFAMAAMQGLLASDIGHTTNHDEIVCRSWQYADKMLNNDH